MPLLRGDDRSRGLSMKGPARPIVLRYGGALAFTALAVLLRWLLDRWLGDYLPFPTLYGAVALAVWFGGFGPAALSAILGLLACDFLFVEPRGAFGLDNARNLLGLVAYLLSCGIIIGFGEAMHGARRRMEQEGRQRQRADQALHDFIRCAPFGIAVFDAQMRYVQVNEPLAQMNGTPAPDHVGKEVAQIAPSLLATAEATFKQVMQTGRPVLGKEFEGETAPGVRRWWEESWFPLLSEKGTPVGAAVIVQEITERKRAENELRQATERLEIVTDSMAAPVTRCSRDFTYLWVSEPYAAWINRPAEQIIGRPIAEIIGPEAFERLRPRFEQVLAGQVVRYEEEIPFRGIGPRWVSAVYTPTLDAEGKPDGWVAVILDMTERKKFEETVRQSEERFRQFAENINEVFWMTDPQTTQLLYISPAYERVWGRSCQSLYDNPRSFMDAVHPEDRQRVRADVLHRQSRGEQTDKEYRVVRPDGSIRWVRDRAFPVKDAAGRFYRLVGIIDDFTERKNAEEALKEADRRKDEFLAVLAHELRNPLAPLRNGLQVIRLAGNDRAAMDRARTIMERQLEHFVRLVDDLLDLSRISRGKIVLHTERIDMATVVNIAVESCDPLIKQSGHELTVTLPDEPVYLDVDKTRIAQVLCNLLTNAAKFSERGSRIWLSAERQGGDALVSVKDTGVGIPAHMLLKVFDMFAQVDRSLEKTQGGLGIGLSIVKCLVEMHGGRVEAHSEGQGMGSEFVVRLPIVLSLVHGQAQAGDGDQGPARPLSRYRVLVVDDNVDSAESLKMMLTLLGNEVRTAHDGLEGVAAAAAYRPDLILLDIGMPKLNGYDVCRRIREQPWGKAILIAAVTGWGQEEDRRRSQEAGFDCHLVKPVGSAGLEKLLLQLPARTA